MPPINQRRGCVDDAGRTSALTLFRRAWELWVLLTTCCLSQPSATSLRKRDVPSDEDASDGCIPNAHPTTSRGK